MTHSKRAADIVVALGLCVLLAVPFAVVFALHVCLMGRPFLHPSERMRRPDQSFTLWKLRSMHPNSGNLGVTGGDKAARIPAWGALLRASRMDEVPQLWNVLRGDMRLIGPRPPLREYVDRFPALYAEVLQLAPGITGLATIAMQRHEGALLSACTTSAQTDAIYARRCVPRKARLDRMYARNQGAGLDLMILFWTVTALCRRGRHRLWRARASLRHRPPVAMGATPRQQRATVRSRFGSGA